MTRKTKKEQAQETRERILDAAEDVFNEKGVSSTALSDVAKAADVTRGAIYWHFKNKGDLFRAMCDRVHQPMLAMIEEIADEKTTDPLVRLREGGNQVMRQVVENPHYRKVLTILFHKFEHLDENDPILIHQKDWVVRVAATLRRVLANAQSKGQLHKDLDLDLATLLLRVHFDGMLTNWLLMPDSFDLVSTSDRLRAVIIDSLHTNLSLRTPNQA